MFAPDIFLVMADVFKSSNVEYTMIPNLLGKIVTTLKTCQEQRHLIFSSIVNDEEKRFYKIDNNVQCYKQFTAVTHD